MFFIFAKNVGVFSCNNYIIASSELLEIKRGNLCRHAGMHKSIYHSSASEFQKKKGNRLKLTCTNRLILMRLKFELFNQILFSGCRSCKALCRILKLRSCQNDN